MQDDGIGRIDFLGNFALLAGCLWIVGALLFGGVAMLGHERVTAPAPAANQTPVADTPATQ
jgi:hypothetical protein